MKFNSKEELKFRFSKDFVGNLRCSGSSYRMQATIERAGFFAIRISPMGACKCLLEESKEGIMKEFLNDGEEWWRDRFVEVTKWKAGEVDMFLIVWLNV